MANLNKVFLIGNLVRDPELKFTPQGTAIAKLGLAVNRQYKGGDGELKKQTDFFTIVVWGKTGESCGKFLAKGRPVFIEGRLQTRTYETQDKQKRTVTEIVADNVQFLGRSETRYSHEVDSQPRETQAEQDPMPAAGDDSIPF